MKVSKLVLWLGLVAAAGFTSASASATDGSNATQHVCPYVKDAERNASTNPKVVAKSAPSDTSTPARHKVKQ